MLAEDNELSYFKHKFDEICYYWATDKLSYTDREFLQKLKASNNRISVRHEFLSELNLVKPFHVPNWKTLVVIEDAESNGEVFKSKFVRDLCLQHCQHFKISLLIVMQSAVRNPRDLYYNSIFRNLNVLLLFPTNDCLLLNYLNTKFFLYNVKMISNSMKVLDSLKKPHAFLAIILDHKSKLAKTHPIIVDFLSKHKLLIKK